MRAAGVTRCIAVAGALALAAGCGSTAPTSTPGATGFVPPSIPKLAQLGPGEGQVNIVAWAGYVENGSTDPKVDWVTPFTKQTGCKVNVKIGATSDEMVSLMKSGDYDLVSASGDATLRLIAGGDVAPVNTDLVPNYVDIFDALKLQPFNSVNGVPYGIPHGRGANLLMWRTDKVTPAPDSWSVVWDASSPYRGHLTAYDSPIYIADAALYLSRTRPDLGIKNPYALDQTQLQAAVDLLKRQRQNIGEYWSDYLKEISAFKSGDSLAGTTWQVIVNLAKGEGAPVRAILPKEGSTGWSDTWMISARSTHPNCAYRWMDWIVSPKVNAQVAEWFGEAPSNRKACEHTADKNHCATYHADDEAYFKQIAFWTTPIPQCLDGRTNVRCTSYQDWTQAWTQVKG